MKKVFFAGDINNNNGPSNVNKELYKYLKDDFVFIKSKNQLIFCALFLINTLKCRTVIYSGVLKIDKLSLFLARIFRKRIIYIMHGCIKYEQLQVNHTSAMGGDKIEKRLFDLSSLILCVSKPFALWFKDYEKQYADKVNVLTNGINWDSFSKKETEETEKEKQKNINIILLGGGRKTKANLNTVKAVELLRSRGTDCRVKLFGYDFKHQDDSAEIMKYDFVEFCGMVNHEELLKEFSDSSVFVQNSVFEPFSLACVEAITSNCSILVSKNVGSSSIMDLTDNDIIFDTSDIGEIADKILFISNNPNYKRIIDSIDKEKTSVKASAEKLKKYVERR